MNEWKRLQTAAVVLTHALQAEVVVVEAGAAEAGVGGEEVGALAVLADLSAEHLTLVHVWRGVEARGGGGGGVKSELSRGSGQWKLSQVEWVEKPTNLNDLLGILNRSLATGPSLAGGR